AANRAAYLQTAMERGGPLEPIDASEDVVIPIEDDGRIAARIYTPQGGTRVPGRLVWMHGGGFVIGGREGFDWVSRPLANASGAELVSVDYRLAPEHAFPGAVRDAHPAG